METLIIYPGTDQKTDSEFVLFVQSTGEVLAAHICSNYTFAKSDLCEGRPERIKEFKKRFGKYEIKFINEANITKQELLDRNKKWYDSLPESEK